MEERTPAAEKGKSACNHTDDERPGPGETTPTCDDDTVKHDAQSVNDASAHQGKLVLDATVVEQAIRFPTDLSLLNESREISEQIIDVLYPLSRVKTKPRTYRQTARKDFLGIVKQRHGYYPQSVLGDTIYGTRENPRYLKKKGIRFSGKPLGRPPQMTEENRVEFKKLQKQRREDYRQRIPIEGKFGQGKNGYNLNYIRAKTARTSEAWINSIFLVMNLMVLLKVFIYLYACSYKYCLSMLTCCLNSFQSLREKSGYSHNVC